MMNKRIINVIVLSVACLCWYSVPAIADQKTKLEYYNAFKNNSWKKFWFSDVKVNCAEFLSVYRQNNFSDCGSWYAGVRNAVFTHYKKSPHKDYIWLKTRIDDVVFYNPNSLKSRNGIPELLPDPMIVLMYSLAYAGGEPRFDDITYIDGEREVAFLKSIGIDNVAPRSECSKITAAFVFKFFIVNQYLLLPHSTSAPIIKTPPHSRGC
ncbi:MAG: hypothetical protein QM538_05650 [Methylacidiphilales bacterium]|nr:hypothetical protein [Candidatus Methylacidiphilales bacterium]